MIEPSGAPIIWFRPAEARGRSGGRFRIRSGTMSASVLAASGLAPSSAAVTTCLRPCSSPWCLDADLPLVKKRALKPIRKMKVAYRVNINPRSHMFAGALRIGNSQIAFKPICKIARKLRLLLRKHTLSQEQDEESVRTVPLRQSLPRDGRCRPPRHVRPFR